MRIGIGALVGILGGPATYARELVAALAALGGHEYVVLTDQPEAFAACDVETVHVSLPTPWHQATWDHWRVPGLVAASGLALYHGTKNVLPWRLGVPAIVTVHDLAVYTCPETFAWPQRWHLRVLLPRSVATSALVIADSEHARADIMTRFRLPPDRVVTVPLGIGARFHASPTPEAVQAWRRARGLGDRIIACVGTIQPRKRVEHVLEAFVRAGGAAAGWELVVAGRRRPGHRPAWLERLPTGAHVLGALPDEELRLLYAAAAIAVSASEYEGFGLTVAEAMASGCAVVAVRTSSIPEVVGEAGLLVERSEPALLAPALRVLLTTPAERARLGSAARARAARFRWEETARRTRAAYEMVLG